MYSTMNKKDAMPWNTNKRLLGEDILDQSLDLNKMLVDKRQKAHSMLKYTTSADESPAL